MRPTTDDPTATMTTATRRAPRALIILILLLCIAGVAVAGYLTEAHYNTKITLACSDTGKINCEAVTSSHYSQVLGLPVALLGLVFFVIALGFFSPWSWRSPSRLMRWSRLGWVSIGMLSVFYLLWAELIQVRLICLYCTSVHVITFLLFVLVLCTDYRMHAPILTDFEGLADDDVDEQS
jgi:uncharacterized membrane protein